MPQAVVVKVFLRTDGEVPLGAIERMTFFVGTIVGVMRLDRGERGVHKDDFLGVGRLIQIV